MFNKPLIITDLVKSVGLIFSGKAKANIFGFLAALAKVLVSLLPLDIVR
jgi:hypothetical protein